jgi:hypothetical protein
MIVLDEMAGPRLDRIVEAAPCALRTGALLFLGVGPHQHDAEALRP